MDFPHANYYEHSWLRREARGNPEVLTAIVAREMALDNLVEAGGGRDTDARDVYEHWAQTVTELKDQKGIPRTQSNPPLENR